MDVACVKKHNHVADLTTKRERKRCVVNFGKHLKKKSGAKNIKIKTSRNRGIEGTMIPRRNDGAGYRQAESQKKKKGSKKQKAAKKHLGEACDARPGGARTTNGGNSGNQEGGVVKSGADSTKRKGKAKGAGVYGGSRPGGGGAE